MPEKHGKYIYRYFPMDNVWPNLVLHTKTLQKQVFIFI